MKNLKKVLALVMTFAMAFTMFTGAAFTDQSDIKTANAVEKLVALNVIKGNPDGSFKPEGVVTRAEMAKMIYVIRNSGNDNADGYSSMTSTFKDINGHWAAGFIKYCQSLNIIAGKSATQFDPEGAVTGTEAAKMLLVCAGYTADKAGLVGHTWDQKTLALASEAGLLDGVTASMTAGLSRQYTAQMISNALDMDTVAYSATSNTFEKKESNKLEWKANPNNAADGQWVSVSVNENVGKKYMGLSTRDGGVLTSVKKEDSKNTFRVETTGGAYTKVATDCSALMGQKVKVLLKDDKADKVYGVYADDASKVVASGSVGALSDVSGDTKKVKLNGTEYKLTDTLAATTYVEFNQSATKSLNSLITNKNTFSAYSVKLIDNDDNSKIDSIVVVPTDVAKVSYVGKTSITVGNKSYKFEDENIYEGVKKDDWAVIVKSDYTTVGKASLTKADTLSAKVTGTKTGEAQVDGKWYKLATGVTVNTGDSYDLIVVGNYIYGADATTASSKDIMYISGNKVATDDLNNEFTAEARAYMMDGTSSKIKVNKIYNEAKNSYDKVATTTATGTIEVAKDTIKGLYTYGKNSDGIYQIRKVCATNKAGYDKHTTANLPDNDTKIGGNAFADDAVVFVQAGTETKVVSGKTAKNWAKTVTSTAANSLITTASGIDYVKVAALTIGDATVPGADGDKMYGYLTTDSYKGQNEKGDEAAVLSIWNGTETLTMYAGSGLTYTDFKAGTAIAYSIKDGKNINDLDVAKNVLKPFAIKGFDGKVKGEMALLNATETKTYTLDSGCVFIGIDDKNTAGTAGSIEDVRLAMSEKKDYLTENAFIGFNTDGKIVAVIYDTENGKLDGGMQIADATSYAVAAPTITKVDAGTKYDGTFTVSANLTNAVVGEAIVCTIKAPAMAAFAPVGNTTVTVTIVGGGTAPTKDPATVTFTAAEMKAGASKTMSIAIDSASVAAITAITFSAAVAQA